MFALQPGKAANMISSVALIGKYKAEDGGTISIPLNRSTILPGAEESEYPRSKVQFPGLDAFQIQSPYDDLTGKSTKRIHQAKYTPHL
jgi:hypothetical protein